MSVKPKTPKPGEMWEKARLNSDGKRFAGSEACCLVYEKDEKLYLAWLGGTMRVGEVGEGMIDGKDGWRRVYVPPKESCTDFKMM